MSNPASSANITNFICYLLEYMYAIHINYINDQIDFWNHVSILYSDISWYAKFRAFNTSW